MRLSMKKRQATRTRARTVTMMLRSAGHIRTNQRVRTTFPRREGSRDRGRAPNPFPAKDRREGRKRPTPPSSDPPDETFLSNFSISEASHNSGDSDVSDDSDTNYDSDKSNFNTSKRKPVLLSWHIRESAKYESPVVSGKVECTSPRMKVMLAAWLL